MKEITASFPDLSYLPNLDNPVYPVSFFSEFCLALLAVGNLFAWKPEKY
jgi:hypothetical protein